jgi:hypothetical protein
VLYELPIPTNLCLTPHELTVSKATGDIFVSCVTVDPGPSTVLRFRHVVDDDDKETAEEEGGDKVGVKGELKGLLRSGEKSSKLVLWGNTQKPN